MRQEDFPADFPLRDTVNADYAQGGSQIVAPLGIPLVPPTPGDTILYAECRADMIKVWKAIIDTVGHYARPDLVRLEYRGPQPAEVADLVLEAFEKSPAAQIERAAEQHGTSRQSVEDAVEGMTRKAARRQGRSASGKPRRAGP